MEVTKESHLPSLNTHPYFLELAKSVPNIPFFQLKTNEVLGRTFNKVYRHMNNILLSLLCYTTLGIIVIGYLTDISSLNRLEKILVELIQHLPLSLHFLIEMVLNVNRLWGKKK